MITVAQITAETMLPALTDEQVLILKNLIKQYDVYASAWSVWPDLDDAIDDEVATPTVKTRALKAVLTQLGLTPNIEVESQGTADSESYYSTKRNWDRLAQDALNFLFDLPVSSAYGWINFMSIPKTKIKNLTLNDSTLINVRPRESGRYEP